MNTPQRYNIFKELYEFSSDQKNYVWMIVSGIIILGVTIASAWFDIGIYTLPIAVALPLGIVVVKYPKAWAYLVVVTGCIFFKAGDDDVSAIDLIGAMIMSGGTLYWLFYFAFVKKVKMVENVGDWLIMFFFFGLLFNSLIAFANDVDMGIWAREYFVFIITLIYFPFKIIFRDEKELKKILFAMGMMVTILGFYQLYQYYQLSTQKLQYAYQIGRTMRVNQTLFTAGSIIGLIMFFNIKKLHFKLPILFFTIISIIAMVSTFSRTFWVIYGAAVVVIFIYLPLRQKFQLSAIIGTTVLVVGLAITLFFSSYADLVVWALKSRLESTSKGMTDVSVLNRIEEYEGALKQFERHPMGGNGLGAQFTYFNIIESISFTFAIIHNSYIYALYRWGFPLSLFIFSFMLYYMIKGFKIVLNSPIGFKKYAALGGVMLQMLLIVASFTSAQIVYRDGIFVNAISCLLISHVSQRKSLTADESEAEKQ